MFCRECAMPRWLETSHMPTLGACWAQEYFEEILFLEDKTQNWKKAAGRKINTCEESMQCVHARKPNHIRVGVFEGDCNGRGAKS
jgi:hypothetical protein